MTLVEIEIPAGAPYRVSVGPGALAGVAAAVGQRPAAVLTDTTVQALYLAGLGPLATRPVLALEPGEAAKSLTVLERVLDFLAEAALDRESVLVTLGGGVVGDLGGLAASLYMRGIDVVQVPTTLLAQVDASVGGKTAVNLAAGKNLAGTFHQPRAVFADTATLASLPPEEFQSGLGEVVKSALLGAPGLFELLEREAPAILARTPDPLVDLVAGCVRLKGAVVARDEHEAGERKQLNLGHTFAHAIEHVAGFGTIPHGVAVGAGLGLALRASAQLGLLREAELLPRTCALLAALGLAPDLGALRDRFDLALAPDALLAGMQHDKKGAVGQPAFVLPKALGAVALDVRLEDSLLLDILA